MAMNEQHGNRPDQRIRQMLDTLPDAPPPGSTFDSAKLWERLRPELIVLSVSVQSAEKQPVVRKKRPIGGWWLVAASVVGLLMGGLWWSGQLWSKQEMVSQKTSEKTDGNHRLSAKPNPSVDQPKVVAHLSEIRLATAFSKRQFHQPKRVETRPISAKAPVGLAYNQPQNADNQPIVSPVEMANTPPESASLTPAATQKPAIANTPKRRYRVVHTNELADEDESNVVRYRAERFVRLGTGSPSSAGSGGESPMLLIPLNRKSIQ